MTEDEARTKWCPFVRTDSIPVRELRLAGQMRCVASECMAWRYDRTIPASPEPLERIAALGIDRPAWNTTPHKSKIDGHCGLAGKP